MFDVKHGWLRPTSLLAGCLVFLTGCPSSSTESQGPGGDDDRPVVMEGSSFKVKWKPRSGASDNGFDPEDGLYKHSVNGTANRIVCNLGGQFEVKRKDQKALIITVLLEASDFDFLQAVTNKRGKKLTIAAAGDFNQSGDELLHPDGSAKIKRVVLQNIALISGSLPSNCTQNSSGRRISCDTSSVSAPSVEIKVCRGNGCSNPAP